MSLNDNNKNWSLDSWDSVSVIRQRKLLSNKRQLLLQDTLLAISWFGQHWKKIIIFSTELEKQKLTKIAYNAREFSILAPEPDPGAPR